MLSFEAFKLAATLTEIHQLRALKVPQAVQECILMRACQLEREAGVRLSLIDNARRFAKQINNINMASGRAPIRYVKRFALKCVFS